ncbi:hypothetical protein ABZ281_28080 [Streptomyces sp. NPDC006265]|uniref:hypothetical protein n=1 Tax=Streptomyces sp. NPDC006265 TaxID=3156740 RepID=UPI0033B6891B
MSGFVKTDFQPGDRVLIDWYGTEKSGTFVKYDPDPRHACSEDHITHPGCRIAFFRADDVDREQTLWEDKLSPLTQDPRQKEVDRLQFQIRSKREEIICLEREIGSREERMALARKDIQARPFQPENVGV